MTTGYLIINIHEFLITLANSALHRAKSETIENSFIFWRPSRKCLLEKFDLKSPP